MIKASDLKRAQELAETLAATKRLGLRVEGNVEGLHLVIGSGSGASEIVLSANYLAQIRRDVLNGLIARTAALEADLRALGVEP